MDSQLEKLSAKLGAKLTKDRPEYPEALRTFEERRLDWVENKINRSIIIQPIFESSGVDSSRWNFINIAWYDDAKSIHRPQWIKLLVEKKRFENIENRIDDLLSESLSNLNKISIEDLK